MKRRQKKVGPAWVYLLHFNGAYWGNARHYCGYTSVGVEARMKLHREGKGSLLVGYALQKKGLDFEIVKVWELPSPKEAREYERKLKKAGHFNRLCTICKEGG